MAIRMLSRHAVGMTALVVALIPATLVAQETPPTPAVIAPDTSQPAANNVAITDPEPMVPAMLAAGTMIEIRIDEAVNSKTHKTGDWYAISLSQPITLGDAIVIPAGTAGRGQVVHSAKSGWGGKAGELILAARYLDYDGRQITLRGMKLGGVGANNEGLAFAASVAGGLVAMPLVFVLNGKNADIAAGTLATAKLSADLNPASLSSKATAVAAPRATDPAIASPQSDGSPVAVPATGEEKQMKEEGV